jgi:uncharacterized repeat protein (TIGR01451 family)
VKSSDARNRIRRSVRFVQLERLEDRRLLASLTVNTVSDSDNPTDPTLSLREAIEVCNGTLSVAALSATAQLQVQGTLTTPNTIDFIIPGSGVQTLNPQSALPAVTAPIVIDGTAQPGSSGKPLVVLDGSQLTHVASGLDLEGGNSTVQGLAIDNFGGNGILLGGSGGDLIAGCFLGVDATGTAPAPNSADGIFTTVDDVTVGGTAAGAGNVISANGERGIEFRGTGAGDLVEGNEIGTAAAGTAALGNQFEGIYVSGPSGVTIGGTLAGAGNVIAGNRSDGIGLASGGNLVEGNEIGVDATGAAALSNGGDGVAIITAGNTVGGTSAGAANVISGNAQEGVSIGSSSATAAGNLVEGNFIGTDLTGTHAVGNGSVGVDIGTNTGGYNNTIGGTTVAARNIISGNKAEGVELGDAGSGNVIESNAIGTDASGVNPLPNTGAGVFVGETAAGNTIGGTTAGAGNVIAANQGDGIDIEATNAVLIAGNFIGTDITGTTALPNTGNGVTVVGARNVTIGGATTGSGDIISGNTGSGVVISGGGTYMDVVQGNLIGTDITGTQNLGNGSRGVDIENTQGNTIGGTAAGAANTIAYSAQDGIRVSGGIGNLISGNAVFANGGPGIDLMQGGNQTQPAPVLTFTPPSSGNSRGTLSVSLTAAASTTYTIEIFANTTLPAAGQEQGQSFVRTASLTTNSTGSGSISLSEPVSFYTATATDPNNNTSPLSRTAGMAPALVDLAVAASVGSGPIAVGSELNYTFTVANRGTSMATGVVLSHTLPVGFNFVSAHASQGTASESAGMMTASLGTIPGGASATVEVDTIPEVIAPVALAARLIADQGVIRPSLGATSIPIDVSPAAPTNVSATVASGTPLTVTWSFTNPPGKTATFNVYRSGESGNEGSTPYFTGIKGNQFTDVGQIPGHIYYYQVTAVIGGLESMHSNEAAGTILTAPTNVKAVLVVQLGQMVAYINGSYPASLNPGVKFNVYRATTAGGEGTKPIFTSPPYYDDGLIVPGHVYYYQESVSFAGVEGPRSAEVPLTFPAATTPASLTGSLAANPDPNTGESLLTLTWVDTYPLQPNASSFRVYEGATSGGESAVPVRTAFLANSDIERLLPGSTQYFEVSAVINGGEGPRSNEFKVVVPPLAAPQLFVVGTEISVDGHIGPKLRWTDTEPGVTMPTYDIFLGTTSGGEDFSHPALDHLSRQSGDATYNYFLLPGQAAYFEVSAVVGSYVGPPSNEVPVTTPSLLSPFLSGYVVQATDGEPVFEYQWTNPDGTAAPQLHYNVYTSNTSGGEGAKPAESDIQGNFDDYFPNPSSVEYLEISAVVGSYVGPVSNEIRLQAPGVLVNVDNIHVQSLKSRDSDLVLSLSGALDPADAQNLDAYHLVMLGKLNKKTGKHATKPVKLISAVYNAATNTVTLALKGKLPNQPLELSINTSAVLDASGQPIAGSSGQSGGTFQATFGKKGIKLASITASRPAGPVSAKAFDALAAMGNDPLRARRQPLYRRK